jgi:hypothetical protein
MLISKNGPTSRILKMPITHDFLIFKAHTRSLFQTDHRQWIHWITLKFTIFTFYNYDRSYSTHTGAVDQSIRGTKLSAWADRSIRRHSWADRLIGQRSSGLVWCVLCRRPLHAPPAPLVSQSLAGWDPQQLAVLFGSSSCSSEARHALRQLPMCSSAARHAPP